MDDVLMTTYEAEERKIGFLGMLASLLIHPRRFFSMTVARDEYPFLTFSAWLLGLAMTLQLMDKILLKPGGLITNRLSSFILMMVMSFVFMAVFYLIGGVLFHFYAYLADSRKDMKNSLAVTVYAWMPFVAVVFITKIAAVVLFGSNYLNPPGNMAIFGIVTNILLGLSILYGWFLAVYGAIIGLDCRILRSILMLFVVPILWFAFLFFLARHLGVF
jgi:hypothetical protein